MRYQGGKSRIARAIAEVINAVYGREIPDSTADSRIHYSPDGGGRAHL